MSKKVIKFYATWCGPCNAYAPIFEKVKLELSSDEIEFVNVNVEDDVDGLAGEYGVKSIPHTILLQDGVKVGEQVGSLREEALKNFILN